MKQKYIRGYKGLYVVYEDGCIWSFFKNRFLRPRINNCGYVYVSLSKDGLESTYAVHRIVAQHFVLNPNGFPHINHKNGIKTDNNADNLEWCTRKQNAKHAIDTGLMTNGSVLTEREVLEIRQLLKEQIKISEIAKRFYTSVPNIYHIRDGRRWKKLLTTSDTRASN